MLFVKVFLILFIVNICTAASWRINYGGKFKIDYGEIDNKYVIIALIAGFKNQPRHAFKSLEPGNFIYLNYSNFGFNPKKAGAQISDNLYIGAAVYKIFAISLGAKAVAYSGTSKQVIAINPCLSPDTLKKEPKKWFRRQAVPLEILSFLLGWLSFLPILKFDAGKYSLALYADQAFWASYGNPTDHKGMQIILGAKEEVLDNEAIRRFSPKSNFVEIDTGHATLDDPEDAKLYEQAIHQLL